jgi:hypothetical protein
MSSPIPPTMRRLKILQKIHMRAHLEELSVLAGRPICAEELESLERTAELGKSARKNFLPLAEVTFEIPFSDRLSERFNAFIHDLHASNASPVYVWVEWTNECGVLMLPSITDIKFGFDFSIETNGVISISTYDRCDRLVLDFFYSDDGDERMVVSVQGSHWCEINY